MLGALEESTKAQRQLVADASHELRTPLTSLRTNVEVLAHADSLEPDERERLRQDVLQQAEELSALVSDVVDLAIGDDAPAEQEELRLDLLAADAVERARRHAPSVNFRTDFAPSVVRGVPRRLDRALANLLDNAAKWSTNGSEVDVKVAGTTFSVRDRGPGFDSADLPLVFDRFYRASEARGVPGSGLGLAIVRQVAEEHGGTVEAANADGGGAVVRLRLPPATNA
jgi:two-component system sensor histidine kinase MprB